MKRKKIELQDIASWDNLQLALFKAAKGKRSRSVVTNFFCRFEQRIAQLQHDILTENVPYGSYRPFVIHDPKRRIIHAASFADRILHHAIINLAEPVFEQSLVNSSYACRPGKGVHSAVKRVQQHLQRYPWYVQVDVEHYFPAIDHVRLIVLLFRRFKGVPFLRLLERIVDSYHASPGKGLPIGSLTSQHFANYYLDSADRFLQNHPAVCAQIRYMDDIVWWCRDKAIALHVLHEFEEYIREICLLKLKPSMQINRSQQGITYCGFRILPGTIRLTIRKQRRYRLLRHYYESAWQQRRISDSGLQAAYDSILAATLPAQSKTWRQRDLQLHPTLYDNVYG